VTSFHLVTSHASRPSKSFTLETGSRFRSSANSFGGSSPEARLKGKLGGSVVGEVVCLVVDGAGPSSARLWGSRGHVLLSVFETILLACCQWVIWGVQVLEMEGMDDLRRWEWNQEVDIMVGDLFRIMPGQRWEKLGHVMLWAAIHGEG
jgi:hypothetical protein